MGLGEYRRKRDFKKTPEPGPTRTAGRASKRPMFVIQKHAARRLHYDLRLELDGVLKSWAVPKGPSLDTSDKRLAVEVEDHPIEYAKFEGRIPEGEYGGGEVIIWDRGTWKPLGDPHAGLKKGHLDFELTGKKLHGAWMLVRMGRDRRGSDKPQWLFVKKRDEFARSASEGEIVEEQPRSVKTGRLVEELKTGRQAVWTSQRQSEKSPPAKPATGKTARANGASPRSSRRRLKKNALTVDPAAVSGAKRVPLPQTVAPQLATLVEVPPSGNQWVHEIKFDGYRILAHLKRRRAALWTRGEQNWTARYPAIAKGLAAMAVKSALFDGEIVALLPSGVSSFQALQNAMRSAESQPQLVYYVFDLLYLDGYDLRGAALQDRKKLLADLLADANLAQIRLSEHFETSGPTLLAESCRLGLEGIVSKRADRPYVSGRGRDWLKSKCVSREELVIGGYTLSTAMPRGIGALLVGYFKDDRLVYAGRVGTGFSVQTMADLRSRLDALQQPDSPFVAVPTKERGKQVRWVRPQLVAQIEFTGWTDAHVLRHPSFEGLREDKPAQSVTRPPTLNIAPTYRENGVQENKTMAATSARRAKRRSSRTATTATSSVRLTSPDRILFPDVGLTKQGLADYYLQVAHWMLPHVVDRPLSLVRCPEGKSGKCFFQKHTAAGTPAELGRVDIREKNETEEYLYIKDAEGLVALAQMSVLEIHLWGSRRDQVDRPDRLIIDLDPHESLEWDKVVQAGLEVRQMLADRGLESFAKLTGGKGIHVVAPIAPRRHDWPRVKAFAKALADALVAQQPDLYTAKMSKAVRKGKIFVDYLRNDHGSTAIAPFSTRNKAEAPVSVPIAWDELTPALAPDHFHVGNVMARLTNLKRDPWKGIDAIRQTLPARD